MGFIEIKYINLCSYELRNFHKKDRYLWNFSCPLCLDSHKNSRKARGYIFQEKGDFIYHCHNCSISLSFRNFLKQINSELYRSFCLELFQSKSEKNKEDFCPSLEEKYHNVPQFHDFNIFSDLKKISDLPFNDPHRDFITKRKIPIEYYSKLFACQNFMEWTNSVKPDTFNPKSFKYDESRIVIPFIDNQKNIIAFQGRIIKQSNNPKYLTIPLIENHHSVFGYDKVNINSIIYVLEGPLNSMFIPNAIAIAGSNLSMVSSFLSKDQIVLVFDNEKRNRQIDQKMFKAIDDGYKIVIFPSNFMYKDINDAIIGGMSPNEIMDIIIQNTFDGLAAKLNFNAWRR